MVKRPLQWAGGRSGMDSSAIAPAQVPARWGTGWRGACRLYTPQNRSKATSTHPPLMLIEERNQLEPPRAGQGEKIAGRDTKTAVMGITASQRLMGAAITDLRLSPKDRSAEKCSVEFASGPNPGTFSSHRDLLWKKGARLPRTLALPWDTAPDSSDLVNHLGWSPRCCLWH